MLNPHERRMRTIQKLRNTFESCAKQGITIREESLVLEIMEKEGVTKRTAVGMIQDLIDMGMVRRQEGLLWHVEERAIRDQYLDEQEEAMKKTL